MINAAEEIEGMEGLRSVLQHLLTVLDRRPRDFERDVPPQLCDFHRVIRDNVIRKQAHDAVDFVVRFIALRVAGFD